MHTRAKAELSQILDQSDEKQPHFYPHPPEAKKSQLFRLLLSTIFLILLKSTIFLVLLKTEAFYEENA